MRRWLLVDCDAVRPSGISATDTEHNAAISLAQTIGTGLDQEGWPQPVWLDSGNGSHLMYRVDLPPADNDLVKNCLRALAARFNNSQVKIDEGVDNPARIWKLPGTLAAKGDNTADRPHRMAKLICAPPVLTVVPHELLLALAAQAPPEEPTSRQSYPSAGHNSRGGGNFDLPAWIAEHQLNVRGPVPWECGGRKWIFQVCPWNEAHANGATFILQFPNGKIAAGCLHDSCAGKNWHDLRDLYEPGWREHSQSSLLDLVPVTTSPAVKLSYIRQLQRSIRKK
jgi:hypothetical protein